jgi:hypothetical protein
LYLHREEYSWIFSPQKEGNPPSRPHSIRIQRTIPSCSWVKTDKSATALRIWGYITRGVYMLGKPERTKVKGLDKKIRLEDPRQFERNGIQDVTQQKLARVEVV